MKVNSFRALFLLFMAIGQLTLSGNAIAEQEMKGKAKIAVFPFQINAPENLSYLRDGVRDMLSSRLVSRTGASVISKNKVKSFLSGYEEVPAFEEIAPKLSVDYVVTGAITVLGETMSIDTVVFSLAGGNTESFFVTAPKMDALIAAIDDLAWNVAEKVFKLSPPKAKKIIREKTGGTSETGAESSFQTAHPERLYMAAPGGVSALGMMPSQPFVSGRSISRSQNIDFEIRAMGVGDVNGDGKVEVLLATNTEVKVYSNQNGRLQELGKISGDSRYTIISVSVADLDGNGVAEVYVCAVGERSPDSFAVEWKGAEYAYLYKNQGWYTRIISLPGRGQILAGQRSGRDTLVEPGVYQLRIKEKQLDKSELLPVPDRINLYDFALLDLNQDGAYEIVALDSKEDRLYVYDQSGKRLWSDSTDFYGGVLRYFGGVVDDGNYSERIYVPSKMIVTDINNDGKPDIIVKRDSSDSTRFGYIKSYPSGEIVALTWDGVALTPVWKTHKIEGYIADFSYFADTESQSLYIALKIKEEGLLFSSSHGEVHILTMKDTPAQ